MSLSLDVLKVSCFNVILFYHYFLLKYSRNIFQLSFHLFIFSDISSELRNISVKDIVTAIGENRVNGNGVAVGESR